MSKIVITTVVIISVVIAFVGILLSIANDINDCAKGYEKEDSEEGSKP